MEEVFIILASVLGLCLILAVMGGILIAIIKTFRGSGKSVQLERDEAKAIQEIHHGLRRMEERVESLETIIFDRMERPGGKPAGRSGMEDR